MKIIFLDLDGVLNTWQYSSYLVNSGIEEFGFDTDSIVRYISEVAGNE